MKLSKNDTEKLLILASGVVVGVVLIKLFNNKKKGNASLYTSAYDTGIRIGRPL